ncbi:hypothetical protein [Legionella feeleii]|uniref:Uncharacterized protein n=1 Tax=Legionella feeleii TaxID=453 RepID=A0A378IXU9_9GAMM|nr:hypothetical protein [Legionella feeleii]STX39732.1 Uncharacterised protein [Legionella feeleii]
MSISQQVTEALDCRKIEYNRNESIVKCVEFAKQMEAIGLLNPERQSSADLLENGINQLKLYTPSFINLTK